MVDVCIESAMQASPELILLGAVIGLFGSVLYALSVVVYRSQKDGIRPLVISSVKMWVALPVMLVLVLLIPSSSPLGLPFQTYALLAMSILLGAVIGDTIYLVSQERIGVSYAFPIAMSFPILTYALTITFLGDELVLSRFFGIVVTILGIVLLSREQEDDSKSTEGGTRFDILGIVLALLTSVLYAVGTTILQVGVTDVDPIAANFVRVSVGSVAFVPMVAVARLKGMSLPTRRATKLVAVAGFFGMAIGSLLYVTAVKLAGAAVTSVVASTAPLFAVPVSVFYLKEKLTRMAILGVILTIAGVVLVVIGV
jgi:drug/metabolite transporter (DMT)-like permease